MKKRVSADGEVLVDGLSVAAQVSGNPFVLPRAPGTYDSDAVSNATAYVEVMPSLTEQSDEPEANINNMVERLGIAEVMARGYTGPVLGDFSEAPGSFQEALHRLDAAKSAFAALPARVRSRFGNDPGEMLEFLERSDEGAFDEAIGLGLIKARPGAGETAAAEVKREQAATPPAGGEKSSPKAGEAAKGAA